MTKLPPRVWLMSDAARLPDPVAAMRALPPGSGVVLRDYRLSERSAVLAAMHQLAAARQLTLLVGADARLAARLGLGCHWPQWAKRRASTPHFGWHSAAAHTARQVHAAAQSGCDLVFISPVFATASHPGAAPLGPVRATALARTARQLGLLPVALGGMDARSWRRLGGSRGVWHGFGAIGFFAPTPD